MKNKTLLSIGAAIGVAATALPVMAGGNGMCNRTANNTAACESYSADTSASQRSTSMTSDSLAFNQLPAQVQSTIKSQSGSDQIHKIRAEDRKGQTVYKIEFARQSKFSMRPELVVGSDGSIIKEKHMANVITEPAGAELPSNP